MSGPADRLRAFAGSSAQRWISTVVRVGLGGVLLVAGGLKVTEPVQAAQAVQAYQLLPPRAAELVGYVLPLLEIAMGLALVLGVATRLMALFSGALMTAFVIGVASAWARGLSIDCGCFGGGGEVPLGEANYLPVVLRDLGFAAMAAWLVAFPASAWAFDRRGEAGLGDLGLYDEWDDDAEADLASGSREDGVDPSGSTASAEEPQR